MTTIGALVVIIYHLLEANHLLPYFADFPAIFDLSQYIKEQETILRVKLILGSS